MPQYQKHFTLEEARALLPDIRDRLTKIHELLAEIRSAKQAAGEKKLRILRGNGKGPVVAGFGPKISDVQSRIEQIASLGIQIKDIERGLIDFPHFLDGDPGREVFLCFELCEDDIRFWHEIEDGYAGRKPL